MKKRLFMGIAAALCVAGCGQQKGTSQTAEEGVDTFQAGEQNVSIYSIKHGSFRMSVGDVWFYVDPVTVAVPPETDYTELPKADYIIVTHAHHDHLDPDAISQLSKDGTVIIADQASADMLGEDIPCIVLANGDCLALSDSWSVEAVPAYNTSEDKLNFHPQGRDNGYVLTLNDLRIYVAGDTEVIPEMTGLQDIDVAFLPCNLPFTMTPEQCAEAARSFSPKVLFPYHYGETDIEQVVALLEDSGIDVRIRQYQ